MLFCRNIGRRQPCVVRLRRSIFRLPKTSGKRIYFSDHDVIAKLILADGTERDRDHSRSVHIGVFEDQGDSKRVIAALRIIQKNSSFTDPLLVEKYFPSAFAGMTIP